MYNVSVCISTWSHYAGWVNVRGKSKYKVVTQFL